MKHILLLVFFNNTDYNSNIIKIILFLFSFALYFAINTLFFSDSVIHKIYEDNGKYNFDYQIPNILYSTIISSTIIFLIKFLALTEQNILLLKKVKLYIEERSSQILEYITIKIIIFLILIYLLLILFLALFNVFLWNL